MNDRKREMLAEKLLDLGNYAMFALISVDNGKSGELIVRGRSIRNAKSYEVRRATMTNNTAGPWELIGSFPKARIVISGLTPATTYAFCVRAVGGFTQRSDWSDPVAHMCM